MDAKELAKRCKKQWNEKIQPMVKQYQAVLVVILVGLLLMLWPDGGKDEAVVVADDAIEMVTQTSYFDVDALEEILEEVLSGIAGAGDVRVVLTVDSSAEQIIAQDSESVLEDGDIEQTTETVIISQGSGLEDVVPIQELAPEFRGALVVCAGGDNPTVCLQITKAVAAVTGLSTDKIAICTGT